ncbi:MAG: twin-arginine translocation signal domain-containing protein [Chthoniobacter sp.]|uniref:twin-arginine translocation signal domain-containing protein n=1 Tax=Chthoniobacter sp. TaxID=2510640 RepID=UPI0032AC8CA4
MRSPLRHSLSRRDFLKATAGAAGSSLLAGTLVHPLSTWGNTVPYDRTLRDRLWMWGHDAGSLKNSYGIGTRGGDILPGEAIQYMGIPNVCMVRFTGTPRPPFDDYAKQFAHARRLTWSFVDGDRSLTTEQKRQLALDLATKLPNLVGLDMDDFFLGDAVPKAADGEAQAHLSVTQVEEIHRELRTRSRPLDLSIVLYSQQLHPAIQRHLDLVDNVYFWTWRARDLEKLADNFAAYRKIAPAKPTLLGIYMWDFGEKKPISLEMMEHQCRLGLQWLTQGEIEGLIFHCTPLCDMNLEAVAWAKDWIARHANDVVRA